MGLRAGLDWCGKSRPTGIRSPDRPARRQSLFSVDAKIRLSSHVKIRTGIFMTVDNIMEWLVEYLGVKERKHYNLYFSINKIRMIK